MSKDVNTSNQENFDEGLSVSCPREKASNGLCLIAKSLLWCTLVLLVLTWLKAWSDGELPEPGQSSHGPWRDYEIGRGMVVLFIMMPFFAGCSAFLAWIVKPTAKTGVFVFLCMMVAFIVTGSHFWLVD